MDAAAADAAMFSYNCWEDDSINTDPLGGPCGCRALLRFSYHRDNPNHDDQVLYSYQRHYFMQRDDVLSENQEKREVLAIILVDAGISESVAELIVNEIWSLAHSMLNDPNNVDRKVLPIAVDIQIRSEARAIAKERRHREYREELNRSLREERARERSRPEFRNREFADDQMARATRDSMLVKFVPATKSSIEALERVTIFDNNSCLQVEECRICLETLPIGAKVLMHILSTRGVLEQGACLDALISIMFDSSANQMDFEECNGIEEVAILIKDKQGGEFEILK